MNGTNADAAWTNATARSAGLQSGISQMLLCSSASFASSVVPHDDSGSSASQALSTEYCSPYFCACKFSNGNATSIDPILSVFRSRTTTRNDAASAGTVTCWLK